MKTKNDTTTAWAEPLEQDRKMNQREKDGLAGKIMKGAGGLGGIAMVGLTVVKAFSKSNRK